MKKLHSTLIALFVLCVAQAQAVTEKDLLGSWSVTAIKLEGSIINFKAGTVQLSEEDAAEVTAKGQDIEEAKKGMLAELGRGFGEMYIEFEHGLVVNFNAPGSQKNTTYTIKEEAGSTYISRSDGKDIRFTLKGGTLTMYPNPDADTTTISFEKN